MELEDSTVSKPVIHQYAQLRKNLFCHEIHLGTVGGALDLAVKYFMGAATVGT